MYFGLTAWPDPLRSLVFSSLILGAMLTASTSVQHYTAKDWATMPPSSMSTLRCAGLPSSSMA